MKKGRSDVYTEGLACTFQDSDLRIALFDLDKPDLPSRHTVVHAYHTFGLDCLVHRTGNGIHFISPTLISVQTWKDFHATLSGINPKCPMTTLRIKPNKHRNESNIWFNHEAFYWRTPDRHNSLEICYLLNKWFGTNFIGSELTMPKRVRYPLPLVT